VGGSHLSIARPLAAAALSVAAATAMGRLTDANVVTVVLVYFMSVLFVSVWQGYLAGVTGALLASICFNYFFLPPVGTLRIAEPENWVSLACFLASALLAGRLVTRERQRAAEADERRQEVEALYALCIDLFTSGTTRRGLGEATSRALRTMGAQGGGLQLVPGAVPGTDDNWLGSPADLELHTLLSREPEVPRNPKTRWRTVRIPVSAQGEKAGELVVYGTRARDEALASLARLLGLALERERLLAEQSRLEGLKASDDLKTGLLRAVSHDLSTPVTAVRMAIESLRRELPADGHASGTVDLIAAETARLHRRIQNLLDLARLESGVAHPRMEPTPPADLFRAVREHMTGLADLRLEPHVDVDCPDAEVDPSLALEILVNLVENAHRASPPGSTVVLRARPLEDQPGRLSLEVIDQGSGLPATGRTRDMPEDASRRGLGLEIARGFAALMGGRLTLSPAATGGVCARLEVAASPLVPAGAPET
jgi:two-component system, OmpR family, sensor histidine kinase KdpD